MADDPKKPEAEKKDPPPKYQPAWKVEHPADPKATYQEKVLPGGSPLIGCRFDPSGKYVFASGENFTISRVSLADGKQSVLTGHSSWVRGMTFLPASDSQAARMVSAGFDGRLMWWPVEAEPEAEAAATAEGEEKKEPEKKDNTVAPLAQVDGAHDGWVRAIDTSPDGTQLATCGNDNLVKLWTANGEPVSTFAGHERNVYNVLFHPTEKALVSFDLMGKIKHWDAATGEVLRELETDAIHKYDPTFRADIGGARCMAFSPDGKYLACGGISNVSNAFAGVGNPAVVLFHWESGRVVTVLKTKGGLRGTQWGINFHPAGFLVGVCAGSGSHLLFWDPNSESGAEDFHRVKLATDARDMDLNVDGIHVAAAFANGQISLLKMAKKEEKKG